MPRNRIALGPVEKLLTATQAVKFAKEAAKDFIGSRLEIALQSAQAKSPVLVQRIDQKDAYYFIVTFHVGARETARFIIDGFTGDLIRAAGVVESTKALPRHLKPNEALDTMFNARASSNIKQWDFEFRREQIGRHPVPVWKPCRQSPSPFMPFYQFSVGASFVYLRLDGVLFQALTSGPVSHGHSRRRRASRR